MIPDKTNLTLSIVSHRQEQLVVSLLNDLEKYSSENIKVIITLNLDETLSFRIDSYSFPIHIIINDIPKGFGANHNQAFSFCDSPYFCVINPDIRINNSPFPSLIACLNDSDVGLAAPVVLSENGVVEDSARSFPTPLKIICKAFGGCKGNDYVISNEPVYPDWVGGMFMMFPRGIFEKLNGFNERFFLYYEDVDLCARLRLLGCEVVLCPAANVIHNAQRSSHRNLKYFKWHFASMLRFFCSRVFFQITWIKLK